MEIHDKLIVAYEVLRHIPKYYNPRIGGSLALYHYGLTDNVDDIDIIIDPNWLKGLTLPYEELPLVHHKRLNDTKRYKVNGIVVDIHESLMPNNSVDKWKTIDNILYSRMLLKRFFDIVYNENIEKWK